MLTAGRLFGVITLFINNNITNDFDQYTPKYVEKFTNYHYKISEFDEYPKLVEYDPIFDGSTFFPKCCPPSALYETEDRECVESKNITSIYEELNVSTNLIKHGLYECMVVIDRLAEKRIMKISQGNGSLVIDGESYPLGKFCVDKIVHNDSDYVIRLCQEKEYCTGGTENGTRDSCIYKCCPDTYALEDNTCQQTKKTGLRVKKNKKFFENVDGYALLYGDNLTCKVANWLDFQQLNFSIKTSGSLFKDGDSREYKIDEYCLALRYNSKAKSYSDMLIVCEFNQALYAKWAILRASVILSCICFTITIAVYIFVYKLKKLVERIIACFCFVDLVFWIMYAMRIFYVAFGAFCTTFGYIYFFIMISRLSWLNVLSYEIWHTLGKVRARVGETKETLSKKMMCYSTYAVIVPMVITLFFILGDQEIYPLPKTIKPYINPSGCAIDTTKIGNYGHYIHLYLPISLLIIINIVFYIRTVIHFLKVKRDLNKISGSDTNQNKKEIKMNNKKGFIILKLGLVMGLTWIYYIYDYLNNNFKSIGLFLIIGDILRFSNVFEGLYFLIIFVMKWKSIQRFMHKVGLLKQKPFLSPAVSTTSTLSVTLSTDEPSSTMAMKSLEK